MKDIIELFQEMYQNGSFVKSTNSSFLVLIAKFGRAHNIKDFKLISLVGYIYELIAKVFGRRMGTVMVKVIENVNLPLWEEDGSLTQL